MLALRLRPYRLAAVIFAGALAGVACSGGVLGNTSWTMTWSGDPPTGTVVVSQGGSISGTLTGGADACPGGAMFGTPAFPISGTISGSTFTFSGTATGSACGTTLTFSYSGSGSTDLPFPSSNTASGSGTDTITGAGFPTTTVSFTWSARAVQVGGR